MQALTSAGTSGRVVGGWVTAAAGGRVLGSGGRGTVPPLQPTPVAQMGTPHYSQHTCRTDVGIADL